MSRPLPFLRSPRPQFVRGLKTAAVVVLLVALVAWLEGLIPTFGAAAFLLILLVTIGVYTVLERDRDCCETSAGPASIPHAEHLGHSAPVSPLEAEAAAARETGQDPAKATDPSVATAHSTNGGCCSARPDHSRESGLPGKEHQTRDLSQLQEPPGNPPGTGCCHPAEVNNPLMVEAVKHDSATGVSHNH